MTLSAVNAVLNIQERPMHVKTELGAETRRLLRSRLILLIALNLFISFVVLVMMLSDPVHAPGGAAALGLQLLGGVFALVVLLVLACGRSLTLRWLRFIEVVAFAVATLMLAGSQYRWYHSGWLQALLKEGKERELIMLASSGITSPWMLLIIVYGTCIPNTGRRCAAMVGAIALVPVLMTLHLGLEDEALGQFLLRDVLAANMLVWLTFASAVAIYGSHKLTVLRREVDAARKLGRYRLLRRLGAGAMGEVYLAEHQLLRRPCAIKLIRPDRAGDASNLQRFEREVHAMAALKHWNTVEIYDYGHADDGTFYYVMEYLPGLSLEQLVQRHGRLPPARALHLLRQVCAALHEAHAVGFIHRDIKPSNIIICERGGVFDVCKLLDFGLVKAVSAAGTAHLTHEGCLVGTPLYMSPEQATGDVPLDGRSDIYSLGAVAYFLLTGRTVFPHESVLRVLHALLNDPVQPLRTLREDVSDSFQPVVLRCLEKAPEKRFADVASLVAALHECDTGTAWTQAQALEWWLAYSTTKDAFDKADGMATTLTK